MPTNIDYPRSCQKNQSKHDPLSRKNFDSHLSGARNEELRLFPWLRELLPNFTVLNHLIPYVDFAKRLSFKIRVQFHFFSVTQRQECKGVQLSNLLSEYGIFVQDHLSLSSRSCPKCARRILTSCKASQEVKQAAQTGPSPGNPSLKRLAKNSPSAGRFRGWLEFLSCSFQGKSEKKAIAG